MALLYVSAKLKWQAASLSCLKQITLIAGDLQTLLLSGTLQNSDWLQSEKLQRRSVLVKLAGAQRQRLSHRVKGPS